jgi:hypothetical protein
MGESLDFAEGLDEFFSENDQHLYDRKSLGDINEKKKCKCKNSRIKSNNK